MNDQNKVTEDTIEEVAAIAAAMRELAEMIECTTTLKDAQCLATGLVAMAEKVVQKSQGAIKSLQSPAPRAEAA